MASGILGIRRVLNALYQGLLNLVVRYSLLIQGLVFANTEHNLFEETGFFFPKKGAYK